MPVCTKRVRPDTNGTAEVSALNADGVSETDFMQLH